MRRLPKPTDDGGELFAHCVGRVRNNEFKTRLMSVVDVVRAASTIYDQNATAGTLYLLPTMQDVAGTVSKKEMKSVYAQRMARKGQPGRAFYDQLMLRPPHGECPLCAQRTVSTLDHYLPESEYPALVVTPANLVPSCIDCNKAKLAYCPTSAEDQLIHPYFDDLGASAWLTAEVQRDGGIRVRFFVLPDPAWRPGLANCVAKHFSVLKLGALYAAHAGKELVGIRRRLARLFEDAGQEEVQSHLNEIAMDWSAQSPNSWQAAMYKALGSDDWFCGGGFSAIPM